MDKLIGELLSFIDKSPVSFFAVKNITDRLDAVGFYALDERDEWKIECGKGYYCVRNDSSVIAFKVPHRKYESLMIAAAHSDSPSFAIKPNAENVREGAYVMLDTECYGSAIMSSWFDIPLSVAGRVVRDTEYGIKTELINIDRDSLIIPNVAIHMERDINNAHKYNPQKELVPLYGMQESQGGFYEEIGDNIGYDMYLYNRMSARVWGNNNELFSAPRIDDLECAYCIAKAFEDSEETTALQVMAVFDNEEVGSSTMQGANSDFLSNVLERVNESLGYKPSHLMRTKAAGFMISADNAHAVHPNAMEKSCPSNRPVINKGIVIKRNANRRYTTDAVSEAMFRKICDTADIPYQFFTNRSDMPGGSTLGNISNEQLSLATVDIGLAQLAMHSSYETAGCADAEYLYRAIKAFYESNLGKKESANE